MVTEPSGESGMRLRRLERFTAADVTDEGLLFDTGLAKVAPSTIIRTKQVHADRASMQAVTAPLAEAR